MDCTGFTKTSSCKICRSAIQEEKLHMDTRFLKVLNKTTFVQGYTYIHWNIIFLIRTFPNRTRQSKKNAWPRVICRARVSASSAARSILHYFWLSWYGNWTKRLIEYMVFGRTCHEVWWWLYNGSSRLHLASPSSLQNFREITKVASEVKH